MTTLFEKIIAREIPANIEYENDLCIVIQDINDLTLGLGSAVMKKNKVPE